MKFRTFRKIFPWVELVAFIVIILVCAASYNRPSILFDILCAVVVLSVLVFLFVFSQCPYCHTVLFEESIYHNYRFCPHCGGDLLAEDSEWYDDYAEINYMQGDFEAFESDGKDMFLVSYKDGMRIHVGYDDFDHQYVISVFEREESYQETDPAEVYRVFSKAELITTLQNIVHTWRDPRIDDANT